MKKSAVSTFKIKSEDLKSNKWKIQYSFSKSPFGAIILASTQIGICYISFIENEQQGIEQLKNKFPNVEIVPGIDEHQEVVIRFFENNCKEQSKINLHLLGTDFQVKVWEALLKIPYGKLTTYKDIAEKIERLNSCRAVGTAIGNNPIAVVIPCHRVVQSTGKLGGYRWGIARKKIIIDSESM
jgi:AraC family transcriptional regulator of adaptative response/methylated-DNA-[protein]-cysteine methyltransferase